MWEWPGYRSPARAERILPHGLVELTWDLDGSMRFRRGRAWRQHPHGVIIGAQGSAYVVDTEAPRHLFGVLFEPGAGSALLGCDASDLTDRTESVGDFPSMRALVDRVGTADDWEARLRAVEEHFAARPAPVLPRGAAALLDAWREDLATSVGAVATRAGVSAPTLTRHARVAFGLAPAQLRRMWRLRRALELRSRDRAGALASLAVRAGYADQAHMTREFRALTGLTPRRYTPLLEGHPFNVAEGFDSVQYAPPVRGHAGLHDR